MIYIFCLITTIKRQCQSYLECFNFFNSVHCQDQKKRKFKRANKKIKNTYQYKIFGSLVLFVREWERRKDCSFILLNVIKQFPILFTFYTFHNIFSFYIYETVNYKKFNNSSFSDMKIYIFFFTKSLDLIDDTDLNKFNLEFIRLVATVPNQFRAIIIIYLVTFYINWNYLKWIDTIFLA